MADDETVAHLRHVAYLTRRSNPPRCHPFTILSLILSGGLIFIGLTMTIISNWPGVTSVGNNPLKIAGPIILCVGVICFIISIILACILNKKDAKRWTQKINKFALSASKQMLDNTQANQSEEKARLMTTTSQTYHSEPGKSARQDKRYIEDQPVRNTDLEEVGFDETDVPDPFRPSRKKKITESSASSSKITSTSANQQYIEEQTFLLPTGVGAGTVVEEMATEETPRTKKKKKTKKITTTDGNGVTEEYRVTRTTKTTTVTSRYADEQQLQQQAEDEDAEQYALKLHIKSSPGTNVYIQHGRSGKESDI